MSSKLIGQISYVQYEIYERLLNGLARVVVNKRYRDFLNFEIDLARVKWEKDSFSVEERKAIFESLEGEDCPPFVLRGDYLDKLEEIVVESNLIIRDTVLSNVKHRARSVYESDEVEEVWMQVVLVCQEGLDNFLRYIAAVDHEERKNRLMVDEEGIIEFLRDEAEERYSGYLRQMH